MFTYKKALTQLRIRAFLFYKSKIILQ